MAKASLIQVTDRYPVGTSVSAYDLGSTQHPPNAAPSVSAVSTGTVAADGSVEFTGLTAGRRYFAYAQVATQHRYMSFTPTAPGEFSTVTIEGAPLSGT